MRKMLSRNQTIELVNEAIESGEIHCDPSTEVKVGDINSESATAGKVIVADGEGGAEWGSISAGMEVVTLESSSGTLSDGDFTKVSGDNCVILYNNEVYYKERLYSGYLYYTNIRIKSGATYLSNSKVEIIVSTKYFTISDVSIDKNQVVANPTLAGTESTLESVQIGSTKYKVGASVVGYEGTSDLTAGLEFTDWGLHRAIKDGNILWLVVSSKILNTTSSSLSTTALCSITLPSEISSKIYRADGSTINNALTSSEKICNAVGTKGAQASPFFIDSYTANVIKIALNTTLTVSANDYSYVEVRVPIFLDIGA